MFKPHPSTRIPSGRSDLKFVRQHEAYAEDKHYDVLLNGNLIGSVYKEAEMTEWACDAGIEEKFYENVVAGYTRIADVMRELRAAAREL